MGGAFGFYGVPLFYSSKNTSFVVLLQKGFFFGDGCRHVMMADVT
jgi:hypothetical protein